MSTGSQELTRHLLELQQQQLDAIGCGDYDAYATMCHPSLTCFEPEAKGNLVEGMVGAYTGRVGGDVFVARGPRMKPPTPGTG
jgi:hypothetical protein